MLIGFQMADLGRRSKWLLATASLLLAAGLLLSWLRPESGVQVLRVFLLVIVALGGYWLSFLIDTGPRLSRMQMVLASAFAVLPWIVVLLMLFAWPQVLLGLSPGPG